MNAAEQGRDPAEQNILVSEVQQLMEHHLFIHRPAHRHHQRRAENAHQERAFRRQGFHYPYGRL